MCNQEVRKVVLWRPRVCIQLELVARSSLGSGTEELAIMAFVVTKKPASGLPANLAQYGPSLAQLARLNYTQALDVLSNTQMD